MAILFQNKSIKFTLKNKAKRKIWLKALSAKEKREVGDINYIFCSDDELLEVNVQYLNHNTYTDIITFDYSEGKKISADIFISVDRVKENAEKFEVDFETELNRVLAHGVLHLCGYKDKKKEDVEVMRIKENASIKLFTTLV